MIIKYKNKCLLKICENKEIFKREINSKCFRQFKKAEKWLIDSKNIGEAQKYRGLNIEKLKCLKNTGSFRINKKYRIIFTYKNLKNFLETSEIIIEEIVPHY